MGQVSTTIPLLSWRLSRLHSQADDTYQFLARRLPALLEYEKREEY
jgi:hypothetical protein